MTTLHVPIEYTLTITMPDDSAGTYVRLDNPGGSKYTPVAMLAGASTTIGPFNEPRDYQLFSNNRQHNLISYSLAPAAASIPNPVSMGGNDITIGAVTAFTPTLAGVDTAGAGTYVIRSGIYQQIGNMIHFNIAITWSAHTGAGQFKITGFPAASRANILQRFAGQPVSVSGSQSPTYLEFDEDNEATLWYINSSTRTAVDVEAAGEFYFNGAYFID